jgi:LmbE family N-acetylglucosaminyl deacetylase
MRRVCVSVLLAGLLLSSSEHAGAAARLRPDGLMLLGATNETRLLVIAPHPDDETLAVGGLMQRVHEAGGEVRVVFLTDGDAYREGVRREDHGRSPQPKDYRGYGRRREREGRNALAALGLPRDAGTFLSFPDQGLRRMMSTYWSERRAPLRSPYTRLDRPPKDDVLVPDTEYRGEDLTQELARVIGDYRPTLILVPRKEDQHPDHCASWYFLMDAVGAVERVNAGYRPDIVNYVVHWNSWPFEDEKPEIGPPPGLRGGASGWIDVPLTAAERQVKQAALHQYRTQVHAMQWFLDGFARSNEIFSRPAPVQVVLPLKRNLCGS